MEIPVQKPQPLIQQRSEIYPTRIKRPNPLLEPSYNPKVMAKQLPKYEGLQNSQPIEIELRGRLPMFLCRKGTKIIQNPQPIEIELRGRLPMFLCWKGTKIIQNVL